MFMGLLLDGPIGYHVFRCISVSRCYCRVVNVNQYLTWLKQPKLLRSVIHNVRFAGGWGGFNPQPLVEDDPTGE